MKKILIIIFISLVLTLLKAYVFDNVNWLEIENIEINSDLDSDWINDIEDLLAWARSEVKNKTTYKSAYYSWWYPPENEWVCSDVIWRAFKEMWVDLKSLVDNDIKNNLSDYSRVDWNPDPNIDFRRVPNLEVFFKNHSISLTKEIIAWDINNLSNWQAWDIVIFWKPKDHIAIVSDKRNKDWVPYIIHNSAPFPREDDWLIYWNENISPIIWHFRWKY